MSEDEAQNRLRVRALRLFQAAGDRRAGFANITRTRGLDRFTLRGRRKVNTQWRLYCMVHNIGKVHRYASGFA
jgi:hypothetical protein